jgi:1-deoxyxylulose-5-phosphate synthase
MYEIDRRRFLSATAGAAAFGAAGVLPAATSIHGLATPLATFGQPPAPPMVTLGNTGIKMSRLGQGTGVHGGNRLLDQSRLGFSELVDLMRHAYDRGIRFFDLADLYGTHAHLREALRSMDRNKLAILTKIWWRYDGPENQTSLPERRQMARTTLERFRRELATDYLDIVLLHCLTTPDWDQQLGPYMDVLNEEKLKGRVRAVGCSCLTLGALRTAAESPWVDVLLVRINMHGGKEAMMDGSREEVEAALRIARKNGKAIIGMKIFGEGQLLDRRDACLKYVQDLGLLDAMTIGFQSSQQVDDVLHLMHKYPAKHLA